MLPGFSQPVILHREIRRGSGAGLTSRRVLRTLAPSSPAVVVSSSHDVLSLARNCNTENFWLTLG